MVPVAGVEPARVISPKDFESSSSANSNTPACPVIIAQEKGKVKNGREKSESLFRLSRILLLLSFVLMSNYILTFRQMYAILSATFLSEG